jgi:hypothetical protein
MDDVSAWESWLPAGGIDFFSWAFLIGELSQFACHLLPLMTKKLRDRPWGQFPVAIERSSEQD